jgi:hypothetical protein
MKKSLIKKLKYMQLKVQLHIFVVILVALSACGDLVSESDVGACDSAIDSRNYDKAISVCTSRKDKAAAYMGKAGYDIINLLKSSSSTVTAYTEPDNASLGIDDVSAGTILNILQLSVAIIPDDTKRGEAIVSSRTNLDSASALLQPYLSELSTDEILLNTFALSFAMQLKQLELYDNASATKTAYPTLVGGSAVSNLACVAVDNSTTASADPIGSDVTDAIAKLKFRDGHLWSTERNHMQCNRMLKSITSLGAGAPQNTALTNLVNWINAGASGALPEPFATVVCGEISALTTYLVNLTANIAKLTLSGDSTAAITNAKTSTNALMTALGCPTS